MVENTICSSWGPKAWHTFDFTCGLILQLPSLEQASLYLGHAFMSQLPSLAVLHCTWQRKPLYVLSCSSCWSVKITITITITIDDTGMHRYNRIYPKAEFSTILAKYMIYNAVHKTQKIMSVGCLPLKLWEVQCRQSMVQWPKAIAIAPPWRCSHAQWWLLVVEIHQYHSTPSDITWGDQKRWKSIASRTA